MFIIFVSGGKNKLNIMQEEEKIEQLLRELIPVVTTDYREAMQKLAPLINEYIQHNFEKLIFLLYRIDVDEKKLKSTLQLQRERDAGVVIAELIIERHLQKLKTRQAFSQETGPIKDNDRW